MRAVFLALALSLIFGAAEVSAPFDAAGAALTPACGPASAPGTMISPANPACTLVDGRSNVWNFPGSPRNPPNFDLTIDGAFDFYGIEAELCAGHPNFVAIEQKYSSGPDTDYFLWFDYVGGAMTQATAPCNAIGTTFFVNNTTQKGYRRLEDMLQAATNRAGLEVKPMPSQIPTWFQGGPITADDIVLTLDPGVVLSFYQWNDSPAGGQSDIVVTGKGATVQGAGCSLLTYAEIKNQQNSGVRIDNNAANPTIRCLRIHNNQGGSSCILTGGHDGLVQGDHLLVYECGGDGTNHDIYISADGSGAADGSCENFSQVISLDPLQGGWNWKNRPVCGTGAAQTQGIITRSYFGCQDDNICSQHAPLDYPCGGDHALTHSYLGVGTQAVANGNGWDVVRVNEERSLPGACPPTPGPNTLVFDADIIDDEAGSNSSNGEVFVCSEQGFSRGTCLNSNLPGYSCVVRNTVFISVAYPIVLGSCSDGGNNRFYRTIADAIAHEGWTSPWTNPKTGAVIGVGQRGWLPPLL